MNWKFQRKNKVYRLCWMHDYSWQHRFGVVLVYGADFDLMPFIFFILFVCFFFICFLCIYFIKKTWWCYFMWEARMATCRDCRPPFRGKKTNILLQITMAQQKKFSLTWKYWWYTHWHVCMLDLIALHRPEINMNINNFASNYIVLRS